MHLYGFILGICFILGMDYFSKVNDSIPKNREVTFSVSLIICALLGARLYHVLDAWEYYSQHLSQIPNTRNGGLAIYGGILGSLVPIAAFSLFYKIPILSITDKIAPILPLLQAIGRLGNFFNKENPLWWPEAVLNLILYFVIVKLKKITNPTAIYLIGYGLIRFFTEFFRTDTWVIGSVKIAQVISLILLILGFILLHKNYSKKSL